MSAGQFFAYAVMVIGAFAAFITALTLACDKPRSPVTWCWWIVACWLIANTIIYADLVLKAKA